MARAAQPKTDRRATIDQALYNCISERGYANTSLADIAERAKMSPSHVGYYFDNKAAILEHYTAGLCEQILAGLPDLAEPDLERLIDSIAVFCFDKGHLNTAFLGVIEEISGLAVHHPPLRKIKSDHATAWRKYFEAFFGRCTPTNGLSAGAAARLVHSMLVGLSTNTLFDRGLTRQGALQLFRDALRTLAGVDPVGTPLRDPPQPARKSKPLTQKRKRNSQ